MIEEIKLSCNETVIQKTLDGKFLVCLSEGVCLEYPCLWDAQDHLRNLELCGLMTKRWKMEPSWWRFWAKLIVFVLRMLKAERLHQEKVFESFLLMVGRCIWADNGPGLLKTPTPFFWLAWLADSEDRQAHGRACVYRREWGCPSAQHSSKRTSLVFLPFT